MSDHAVRSAGQGGPGRAGCGELPAVHILLATYNGARFLPQLLDSLRAQSDRQWLLLVRDDGSSDDTVAILRERAAADPRIRLVEDGLGTLGASRNFARLAEVAGEMDARYFAFCDQDDVWHPEKLARLRGRVLDAEAAGGAGRPVLAFSDLRVVDAAGSVRAASYLRHAGIDLRPGHDYYWLIAQNAIPGCAMLGNRALLELALPLPPAAIHHDWWFALCAAAAGRLVREAEALVDYRVHGSNAVGVKPVAAHVLDFLQEPGRRVAEEDVKFRAAERQARALAARLRRRGVHGRFASVLERYLKALLARQPSHRILGVLSGPVRRFGLARNMLMMCQLARARRTGGGRGPRPA